MSIDGVVIDAADTPENEHHFGKPGSRSGEAAFPQLRIVGLGECGTHAVVSAAIAPYHVGERELTVQLIGDVTPDMLVLADRGFYSHHLWGQMRGTGAALVWRVRSDIDLPVLQVLPDGSYLSRLISPERRKYINKRKRLGNRAAQPKTTPPHSLDRSTRRPPCWWDEEQRAEVHVVRAGSSRISSNEG